MDFSDYRRISAFFDYGSENDNHILREKCEKLLHSEECRRLVDQAIELFVRKLPLQQMQTGPADEMGLGKEYADYRKLIMIVQQLGDKPRKGEQLLQTALRAPVINNRNMALTVLESWVEMSGRPLKEISPALYDVLLEVKSQEMVETVRERMEKLTV